MSTKFDQRVLLSAPHMSGLEQKYINQAFDENWVMPLGPHVTQFEKTVADYLAEDSLYGIAMSSGTAAIHIALKLLQVKKNDEVFCSSATFAATANPIVYEGAVPVFIDSEIDTWNICPDSLLKAIEHREKSNKPIPKILIAVDLFGMSANYSKILEICRHYSIELIEDSAESLGSSYKNRKCGVFGRFGILSFNGNKIITTSGGGMLITHDKTEAEKALFLITQARDKASYYLHSEIGYNYRLSNISASIGLGQMSVLDSRVSRRRSIFDYYKASLKNSPLEFQSEPNSDFYSNHWLSAALIKKTKNHYLPESLIKTLDSNNIEARHVWKPMHTQPIFKKCDFFSVYEKPVSEIIFEQGICLPSSSYMNDSTVEQVCEVLKSAIK